MLVIIILCLPLSLIRSTIDINAAELQYLADHLTPEECRRLMASVHFKTYNEPNALDQAERKVPKDVTCLEHLYHWNSIEGKGQTHTVLEHRLRQMGKVELADWLGKTVFHQIGVDLDESINKGLTELTSEDFEDTQITLEPLVPKIENPTDYSWYDYMLYGFVVGLVLTLFGLCFKLACNNCCTRMKKRKKLKKNDMYNYMENDSSGSENEENKFDIRTLISSSLITK